MWNGYVSTRINTITIKRKIGKAKFYDDLLTIALIDYLVVQMHFVLDALNGILDEAFLPK